MSQRKVLYYPTIIIPLSWLKWAALYWDKVSSIIPEQWEQKPTISSPFAEKAYGAMNQLKEQGIFEPIRPQHPEAGWNVTKELINYRKLGVLKIAHWKKNEMYKIHREKFNLSTLRLFEELHLVERDKNDTQWFFVEKNTYFRYMAVLAKYLADMDPNFTVVSTDNPEYERLVFETSDRKNGFASLMTNFQEILPSPREETPIEDIIKFRKDKHNELLSFREVIDAFQMNMSRATDYREIKEITVQNKERIERERTRLSESLRDSKISSVFATATLLIDIKSPSLWETIILSLGPAATKLPPWISAIVIAGTAGIQVGATLLDKRSENTAKIRESPFSYLYLAEQNKIIQKQT